MSLNFLYLQAHNSSVIPSTNKSYGNVGTVLLCLFALPFAGFGLFALSQAVHLAFAGPGNTAFLPPLMFGLVFSAIGFGLILAVFVGTKQVARQQKLQAEHPSEPWLWRADWAQGRAQSQTRTNMIAGWVATILWNLVSTPLAFLVLPAALKQRSAAAWLALLFPAIGLFLLARSIRQTVASCEFGKTFFEMSTLPGAIGGELKGSIDAHFPHSPDHGVHLRLSCVLRVKRGSGNSYSVTETILWRDECNLDPGQLEPSPTGTRIPVTFHIPADVHPTEKVDLSDAYVWILEAIADLPGLNYHDSFEVPVFRVAQTLTSENDEHRAFVSHQSSSPRPAKLSVEVSETARGAEFYFAAARNKSLALSVTAFAVIFSGVTYSLVAFTKAPAVFQLAFGFFSLLLICISGKLWLGTSRVVISSSLTVQSGVLGFGRVRTIAFSEIAAISDRITSQMEAPPALLITALNSPLRMERKSP